MLTSTSKLLPGLCGRLPKGYVSCHNRSSNNQQSISIITFSRGLPDFYYHRVNPLVDPLVFIRYYLSSGPPARLLITKHFQLNVSRFLRFVLRKGLQSW